MSYFDHSFFKEQKKTEVRMTANLTLPYKLQIKKVAEAKAVVWKRAIPKHRWKFRAISLVFMFHNLHILQIFKKCVQLFTLGLGK